MNGKVRPGDNLYTCSIVAINPDTGKLAWAFQPSPHDTHDWDAVEVPVIADATLGGVPRKLLMQASRNGYFFVLDRTTGKNLLTSNFGPVNWTLGVDKDGRPIPNPATEPAPNGRLIAPDEGGMTNYRSPSFDLKSGLFIVSASPSYSLYFSKPADGSYGWAGGGTSLDRSRTSVVQGWNSLEATALKYIIEDKRLHLCTCRTIIADQPR